MDTKRYLVLRVPNTGPKALIAAPNDFATESEAQARIDAIEALQLQGHHTYLEVWPYRGDKFAALAAAGVLY
jgi:hypothetical protein